MQFEAGFFGFGEVQYQLSFEVRKDTTFSSSSTYNKSETYNFPVKVPPGCTYVTTVSVQEADMEVPYEMVFEAGGCGKQRKIRGIWKGVAVSHATYEIQEL